MGLVIQPPEGAPKVFRRGGKVLMYVGTVLVTHRHDGYHVCITPRKHITAEQYDELITGYKRLAHPKYKSCWTPTPEGWVAHISFPVRFTERALPQSSHHRRQIRRLLCGHHDRAHLVG